VEFARLCIFKKWFAAAARFYRDAFAADPRIAGNVAGTARYDAACAASLAGCGQGKDADKLDDKDRAQWRQQALDWLRADLTWWSKALDNGGKKTAVAAEQTMRHWQTDPDLAGVRDKDGLARLPDAERRLWEALWSDVAAVLNRAGDLRAGERN
jgi:hypothetical protein